MKILKRNGTYEQFSSEKLMNALKWACGDFTNVEPLEIVSTAQMRFVDGMKSSKVQETLIKASDSLISLRSSDYQYVAARLLSMHTRKQIFGVFLDEDMPKIEDVIRMNAEHQLCDIELLSKFSEEDFEKLNDAIDHSLDHGMEYAAYRKMTDTYVTKNRHSGYVYETPQYAFMRIAIGFSDSVDEAIKNYELLARKKSTSYATPILSGVGTGTKQFASCVLIDIDDSTDSMGSSIWVVMKFISKKAGLGLNFGRWRAKGSKIRNGEVVHTGVIPMLRMFMNATKAFSQGGIRGGAATAFYPLWTYEFEELVVLKNSKGNEDNRLKSLDYGIQISDYFYKRMLSNQDISFFSTSEVPGLYESYGKPEIFNPLYEKYEADSTIRRKTMKGLDVIDHIASERQGHGKFYTMNVDNVEKHNRFDDKINMSNLCFTGDTKVAIRKFPDAEIEFIRIDELAKQVIDFDHPYKVESAEHDIIADTKWHTQSKPFVAFRTSSDSPVIEIELENGNKFKCTKEHLLATTKPGEYVQAYKSLKVDVETYFGSSTVISIADYDERQPVYDLHVKDNHNFYIGDNTSNAVLVHNCMEILLPTKPIQHIDDTKGEIALCNLGALNLGFLNGPETFPEMRESLHALVRNVDKIITLQDTIVAASDHQRKRRSLGIGVTNFAYWMAKNKFRYDDPNALPVIDELFEHFQYYLIEGSMLLAKEIGRCEYFDRTRWSRGFMPIDVQNENAYKLTGNRERKLDWEWLRSQVAIYGMRNSVLSAFMPVESSSLVSNSTNGMEPPRSLLTKKGNETSGFIPIIVPEALALAEYYTTAWELENINSCINKIAGIAQMWVDQAISVNHYYNPLFFEGGQVERKKVIRDIIEFNMYGGKNLYYANTDDSSLHTEEYCESCVV